MTSPHLLKHIATFLFTPPPCHSHLHVIIHNFTLLIHTLHCLIHRYEAGLGLCEQWTSLALDPMGLQTTHAFGHTADASGSTCTWESGLYSLTTSCLLPYVQLCAVVRAKNAHGLWGSRRRSPYLRVCRSVPAAGSVSDGLTVDGDEMDFTAEATTTLRWRGFSDDCSTVVTYSVQLEQLIGASWLSTVAAPTVLPASTRMLTVSIPRAGESGSGESGSGESGSVESASADLHFRARVCATTAAGHTTCSYSDGFVVDETPPTTPVVCTQIAGRAAQCDGAQMGLQPAPRAPAAAISPILSATDGWQRALTEVARSALSRSLAGTGAAFVTARQNVVATWKSCEDYDSGIAKFVWSISVPAATNGAGVSVPAPPPPPLLYAEEAVGLRVAVPIPESVMLQGSVLIHVACFNGAGLSATTTLGPVGFDGTPPEMVGGPERASHARQPTTPALALCARCLFLLPPLLRSLRCGGGRNRRASHSRASTTLPRLSSTSVTRRRRVCTSARPSISRAG